MSSLALIPQPARADLLEGRFVLRPDTPVIAGEAEAGLGIQFCAMLAPATGFNLAIHPALPQSGAPAIEFKRDDGLAHLGPEGYRLTVSPQRVVARAPQPAGLHYAAQSLRQLLPPQIFSPAKVNGVEWAMPCVEIEDAPRFSWRGAMLDVSRHYAPKEWIVRFLDLLALHKLNTFHWHLTDDQGWRIEIIKYPRLTGIGAWRQETVVGHMDENLASPRFDGKPHGGFYTQDDVRELVAYAQARGITIVPEIEMPGHARAALAAYPGLGNTGQPVSVSSVWGIHEDIYNVEESTLRFLQDVLDEILSLFPSPYIHIGGDEVPKTQWQASPAAQRRMRALGLQNEEELQSYFIRRMDAFLTSRGRRLMGWDEILEGGLAANATVMSWRGEEGGVTAAKSGHDVVMAPMEYTYLDHYQSEDTSREPLAIGGFLPLEKVYGYEPICAGIDAEHARHVLGTQVQLWREYMPTQAQVEYMAFPRLCALAEVAWTSPDQKDYAGFTQRLPPHLARLDQLGVGYRKT